MSNTALERIEADIGQLPLSDQLRLIERLAQHIRQQALPDQVPPDARLEAMANDPDIQREQGLAPRPGPGRSELRVGLC